MSRTKASLKIAEPTRIEPTREWISVSVPIEYIDFILEAIRRDNRTGCVSEFVRDAIREKLSEANIGTAKYETVFERYGLKV